jgi:hypothetical protein
LWKTCFVSLEYIPPYFFIMTDFNKLMVLDLKANLSAKWTKWKKQYNVYVLKAGFDKKSDEQKVAMLINLLGPDARDIFDNITYTGEEAASVFEVVWLIPRSIESRKKKLWLRDSILPTKYSV